MTAKVTASLTSGGSTPTLKRLVRSRDTIIGTKIIVSTSPRRTTDNG